MNKLGLKCIIDPSIKIIHYRGKSESVKADKWIRLFSAKSLYFSKNWNPKQARRRISMLNLYSFIRMFGLFILRFFNRRLKDKYNYWKVIWKSRNKWKYKKIMAIASGGGHWIQLLRTRPAYKNTDLFFVTTHKGYKKDISLNRFYNVIDGNQNTKFKLLLMAFQVLLIIIKESPNVIITTGAAPGFFALFFGKIFRRKTVWIDSIANAEELSLSGKKAKRFADLYLTQWEDLAKKDGPKYYGAVL